MTTYTNFKKRLLKDKRIKKAYDALGPEFELIGTIIKKRLEQGITQKELARKIGSKQPVISRLERGTYNPSIKFLHRVANALDAELSVKIR